MLLNRNKYPFEVIHNRMAWDYCTGTFVVYVTRYVLFYAEMDRDYWTGTQQCGFLKGSGCD